MKYKLFFTIIYLISSFSAIAQNDSFVGEWTGNWSSYRYNNVSDIFDEWACKMTIRISGNDNDYTVRIKETATRDTQSELYYHNPAIEIKHINNGLELLVQDHAIDYSDSYNQQRKYILLTLSKSGVLVLTGKEALYNTKRRCWEYFDYQPMHYFNPQYEGYTPIYQVELFQDSDDW